VSSFAPGVGGHCNCPSTTGPAAQEALTTGDSLGHVAASHAAGPVVEPYLTGDAVIEGATAGTVRPNLAAVERVMWATLAAQRRLRKDIADVETEDAEEVTERGGIRWRQAWQAKHSKLRLRIQALDAERKTVLELRTIVAQREQDELVRMDAETAAMLTGGGEDMKRRARGAN
jgi:hypothetical protein